MNVLKTVFIAMIFSFFVTGCDVLINPQAKIVVTQRTTTIFNNAGVFDFSKVEVNKSSTVVFKIENKGRKTLKLTGSPIIEIFGQDKDSFSISAQPETSIRKGENTTFELRFSPTESKFYEAALSIPNNDPKRNPFVFTVKGRGVIIDIDVMQGATHIANDTGLFDFGEIYLGNPGPTFTFTIENIGSTTLYLTGTQNLIEIQGYGASAFKINQTMTASKLEPGETTTFDITFDPQTGGVKSAKILFENSDPDENPYNFMIRGICLSPEIQVLDPDKKDIPNITGEYTFPDNHLNNKREYTFTIKNLGTTDLILSGSPFVEITGTNSSSFTVIEQPDDSISAASNSTFVIAFKPTAESAYSATVTIINNDEDENPFVFTIRALGYATKFDFNGDGFDDILISSRYNENEINATNFDIAYLFLGGDDYPKSISCDDADIVFRNPGDRDDVPSGVIVAVAGDINSDGYDDILISNNRFVYSEIRKSQVLIFFGRRNPPSLLKYTDADVLIEAPKTLLEFGWGVSSVGDFNNDGFDDFMLGCHDSRKTYRDSVYLFLGKQSWDSKISSTKADMIIFGGIDSDSFGYSISSIGDFNGDGFDDVIIGESRTYAGNAYIFFGESSPPKTMYSEDADVTLTGENQYDEFGDVVSKAGDINNDGFDDVVVGARRFTKPDVVGCAYVYFGSQNPKSSIDPTDANIRILGDTKGIFFSSCVSNAGDVNDDGFDDLLISNTYSEDVPSFSNSSVFIFFGASNPIPLMDVMDADVKINADKSQFTLLKTISSAGDFNGDRIDDFFLSFYRSYINKIRENKVYMFNGNKALTGFLDKTDANLEFYTNNPNNFIGLTISGGD